jgi:hypothetical protein
MRISHRAAVALVAGAALCGVAASAAPERVQAAGERLGARVGAAVKAEGPFFTAAERAVIERKCGYQAGSFDGMDANINNGVLVCGGGKRVDDAEVRALLAMAEPRIERRVRRVMESAEVQAAIRAVASEAERHALAAIDQAAMAREAAAAANVAAREARIQACQAEAEARRR